MPAFAAKLPVARHTSAWHLALDKFPFNLNETASPSFSTTPDNRGRTNSIKATRLAQIRDRFNHADTRAELQTALDSRRAFLDLLEKQHGPRFRRVTLVNTSRLLLHLGRASVLENVGLYCDHTTGLPLIPGSAVKGVVSTWACWEGWFGDEVKPDSPPLPAELKRADFRVLPSTPRNLAVEILGSDDDKKPSCGNITFMGALPSKLDGLLLTIDLVTPHTSGQPVPSPFLAWEAGASWEFLLLAASSLNASKANKLLNESQRWLTEALREMGLGAKVAAGYGKFDTSMPVAPRVVAPAAGTAEAAALAQVAAGELSAMPADSAEFAAEVQRLAGLNRMLWPYFLKPQINKLDDAQRKAFRELTSGSGHGALRIEPWYPKAQA